MASAALLKGLDQFDQRSSPAAAGGQPKGSPGSGLDLSPALLQGLDQYDQVSKPAPATPPFLTLDDLADGPQPIFRHDAVTMPSLSLIGNTPQKPMSDAERLFNEQAAKTGADVSYTKQPALPPMFGASPSTLPPTEEDQYRQTYAPFTLGEASSAPARLSSPGDGGNLPQVKVLPGNRAILQAPENMSDAAQAERAQEQAEREQFDAAANEIGEHPVLAAMRTVGGLPGAVMDFGSPVSRPGNSLLPGLAQGVRDEYAGLPNNSWEAKYAEPVGEAAGEFLEGMAEPQNLATLGALEALSGSSTPEKFVRALANTYFAGQMGTAAVGDATDLYHSLRAGDTAGAVKAATSLGFNVPFAAGTAFGAAHEGGGLLRDALADRRQAAPQPSSIPTTPAVDESNIPFLTEQDMAAVRAANARPDVEQSPRGPQAGDLAPAAMDDAMRAELAKRGLTVNSEGRLEPTDDVLDLIRAASAALGKNAEASAESAANAFPAKERVNGIDGKQTSVLLPDGRSLPAIYRLIEADDANPSHDAQTFAVNPEFPGSNQRSYQSDKNLQAGTIADAQNFKPGYIINGNSDAVNGPSIVTPGGDVAGGTRRAMIVQRLYDSGRGDRYANPLRDAAGEFGFTPEDVDSFMKPLLVREIQSPQSMDEWRGLISDLNTPMTAALGVNDKAVSAGLRISPETLSTIGGMVDELGEGGSLSKLLSERGTDVLNLLRDDGVLRQHEISQYVQQSKKGPVLSKPGRDLIEKSLLGSVIRDPELMNATSPDVLNKVSGAMGSLAALGSRDDDFNIAPALREALGHIGEATAHGMSVDDYLKQRGLSGAVERTPAGEGLASFLADHSQKEIRKAFRSFAQDAKANVQGQSALPMMQPPKPADAFNEAFGAKLRDSDFGTAQAMLKPAPALNADTANFRSAMQRIAPGKDFGELDSATRSAVLAEAQRLKASVPQIERAPALNAEQRAAEDRAITYTQENFPKLVSDYMKKNTEHGTVYVVADRAKDMLLDFKTLEERSENSAAVHNASTAIADAAWERALRQPVEPDRRGVLFVTGVPGIGKTASYERAGALDQVGVLFEKSFSNSATADRLIQETISSGRTPLVNFVYADDPKIALLRAVRRAEKQGRTVPIGEMARTYAEVPRTLLELAQKYGDKLHILAFDNSAERGASGPDNNLDALRRIANNWTVESTRKALSDELNKLHAEGEVSDRVYRGFEAEDPEHGMGAERRAATSEQLESQSRGVPQDGSGRSGSPEALAASYGEQNTLFTKQKADQARGYLRELASGQRLNAGLDPAGVKALIDFGGYHLEAGLREFAGWSKQMVADLGEWVKPHLQSVWEQLNAMRFGDLLNRPDAALAANISLEKLGTPEDVLRVVRQAAESNEAKIDSQRRGVMSDGQIRTLGEQMGMNADEIAKLRRGTALNAEQLLAARRIMVGTAEDVRVAQERYQNSRNPEDLARLQEAIAKHVGVQTAVSGATAEAGRALRQFRVLADALRTPSQRAGATASPQTNIDRVLGALRDHLGEEWEQRAREISDKLAEIPPDDVTGMNRFLRNYSKFTTSDKISAYFIANLLSGVRTPLKKALGDAILGIAQVPQRVVRGALDLPISKLQGRPQEFFIRETLPALKGYLNGIADGARKAAYILKNGFDAEQASNFDIPARYEFPGGIKNPWNVPGRVLTAVTSMFRTMAFQGELYAQATRQGLKEGLKGEQLVNRVSSLIANPTPEIVDAAMKQAKFETYTSKPDILLQAVSNIQRVRIPDTWRGIGGLEPVRFVMPFLRIPYNLVKTGLKLSPAGAVQLLDRRVAGSPEASDVLARSLLGSGIMATAAIWAAQGLMTGAEPHDAKQRAQFYAQGKQPFSIRIGDRWISYNKLGPLGIPLSAIAAWYDKGRNPDQSQLASVAATVGKSVLDETFFRGFQNLADMAREPNRYAQKTVSELAEGFVPLSSALRQMAGAIDPKIRDARGIYERVIAGIPLASKTLPAKLDPFGRPVEHRGSTGLASFSPVSMTPAKPLSDIDSELDRLGIAPGYVGRTLSIANQRVQLTPAQQRQYQRITGQTMLVNLRNVISSPQYQALSDEQKHEEVTRMMEAVRHASRSYFLDGLARQRAAAVEQAAVPPMLAH